MEHYFNKFPVVGYNGKSVRNIMTRNVFDEETHNNPNNFNILRLEEDTTSRVDIIAKNYYGSSTCDWLFYYSNKVVDPYNDVIRNSENFTKFIISKYSSIQRANNLIVSYVNNWSENTDDKLTVAQYDSATVAIKKYYTAAIDYSNRIVAYERHTRNWMKSTNKIVNIVLGYTELLRHNDIVIQYDGSTVVARGQISNIDTETSTITVQHIVGTFVDDAAKKIKAYNSVAEYTVESLSTVSSNITEEEESFWSPYTAYQYESEKNESLRNIKLLRSSLRASAEEQLDNLTRS